MQKKLLSRMAALLVLALVVTVSAFRAKPGGDSYQVYVNNKLVLKDFVYGQKTVKTVELAPSEVAAQLSVVYSHCGKLGQSRQISIRDEKNTVLKEWRYQDGGSTMNCSMKEVLNASVSPGRKYGLFYGSRELEKEVELAVIVVN